MAPATRLSGLQKEVLALYRSILRETIRKDRRLMPSSSSSPASDSSFVSPPSTTDSRQLSVCQLLSNIDANDSSVTTKNFSSSTSYARDQFRKEASLVRRSDFKTIEYKIRKGKKQLQLLKMPGVNLVGGLVSS